MSKRVILISFILILVLGFAGFKFIFLRKTDTAGLRIVSHPTVNIFLNDKLIGKTPFEDKFTSGEYILKLIPEETNAQVSFWQGKIKLNPSVLTYVNRDLGPSELTSAGEVLALEKISQNKAQLAVYSAPDASNILIDGQDKGITPLFIDEITSGEHDIAITSSGFVSRTVRIQITSGYKLIVNFQLSLAKEAENIVSQISPTPTSSSTAEVQQNKPYVVIKDLVKDTEIGYLRVRQGPSTATAEVAKAKAGEKYQLLEEKTGWYKISYDNGKEGWISSRYADKKE